MASENVLAELASRMNTKDEGAADSPSSPADESAVKDAKPGSKNKEKQGSGKHLKRSKSHDPEKSPNGSKKKGKSKPQKVDSDSGGEGETKKAGFFSNLKKAFKKKPSGKHRKHSAGETNLKSKSRSESDLIGAEGLEAGSRHSWASGLDDAGGDGGKGGKKSGISSFFDKKIRDSFRNKFKIKSRKTSLDKKSGAGESRPQTYSPQRPLSDSNIYQLERDGNFFDDSFFTVSLTNGNDSFASQPDSIVVEDLSTLDSSQSSVENVVAKSKIQAAPKNRRKPSRFRGSKAMSDTTDNMASTSSLGMISEVTSDEDGKLSPVSKDGEATDNYISNSREERPAGETEMLNLNGPSSSLGSSSSEIPKAAESQRSNSLLGGINGPAGDLSRVLTSSLSSVERIRLNSRSSDDKEGSKLSLEKSGSKLSLEKSGSKSSLDKSGSRSSLHEFELKRQSLRSASSKELSQKASDSEGSRSDITKRESPRLELPKRDSPKPEVPKKPISPKLGLARPHSPKLDISTAVASEATVTKHESPSHEDTSFETPIAPKATVAVKVGGEESSILAEQVVSDPLENAITPKGDVEKTVSPEKAKKESRIPIQAKAQPVKLLDDQFGLLSSDAADSQPRKGSLEDKPKTPLKNGVKVSSTEVKSSRLPEPGFNANARPEPGPRPKGSALPVLDRSKRAMPAASPDESGDGRDRTKSAGGRLNSQSYRFGNKALSLDDDFRSNDDKSAVSRTKSLNYDPKKLRFANKGLSGKESDDVVNNGGVASEQEKPNWVSIAKDKQKRNSMDLTEPSPEEKDNDKVSNIVQPKTSPITERKPEIPKKPKGLKQPSSPLDLGSQSKDKDFVRTTRGLKIQSGAAPAVDLPADSNASGANCIICGKISYMFGRFERDGQFIHKNCAKCSVCGTTLTAETLSLKEKAVYCQTHA